MSSRTSRHRRQTGATLVELMVVVGIIGALTAAAMAYMPRMSLDLRISRTANTFSGLVREARGRAMADRAYVRVCVSGNRLMLEERNTVFGAVNSGGDACGHANWEKIRSYIMDGSDFTNVLFPPIAIIEYNPRGLLESGNGLYEFGGAIRTDAVKHMVVINAVGFVEKR